MKRFEIQLIYYMACMFVFFMPGFTLLITNPTGPLSRVASTMMFFGLLSTGLGVVVFHSNRNK